MASEARAWCRVDLAGGTLDIWPLGLLHPGAKTINLAIDIAATVRVSEASRFEVLQGEDSAAADSLEALADHSGAALIAAILSAMDVGSLRVEIETDSPRGAGLGGSSALSVSLIAATEHLFGRPQTPAAQVAYLARDLEARLMGLPTGCQDHFPALLGGALEISHEPGGEKIRSLDVDLESLSDSLVVAYTGQSHFSAGNNWEVVRRRLEGHPESVELFDGIREVAEEIPDALEAGDLATTGSLMTREWELRRQLAPAVSTPLIEDLLAAGRGAGAWGGKATGAGGGGCIALLSPTEAKGAVTEAVRALGVRVLAASPASGGVSVRSVE